jgi:hypothetical protein
MSTSSCDVFFNKTCFKNLHVSICTRKYDYIQVLCHKSSCNKNTHENNSCDPQVLMVTWSWITFNIAKVGVDGNIGISGISSLLLPLGHKWLSWTSKFTLQAHYTGAIGIIQKPLLRVLHHDIMQYRKANKGINIQCGLQHVHAIKRNTFLEVTFGSRIIE